MKNILVVNVNWLGDVIFTAPIFTALKDKYPQARICCLAPPRVKGILECMPAVDEILEVDEKGQHKSFFAKWHLVREIRQHHFDIVFLLHRSWTRALLVFLAGIPIRVGYNVKQRGIFLTKKIQPVESKIHRADTYFKVIEEFGVPIREYHGSLRVPEQMRTEVNALLERKGLSPDENFFVFNPGGNWDLKRWPIESWKRLAEHTATLPNHKVVVTGAKKDQNLAAQIREIHPERIVDMSGETTLPQLLALLERAALVVTADSGPMHVAHSVGTAVIALFGPTRPEITGPMGQGELRILLYDVGCNRVPCYHLTCPDNLCMQAISVEDVKQQISNYV